MAKAKLIGVILGGIIQCGYATFLSEGEIRAPEYPDKCMYDPNVGNTHK